MAESSKSDAEDSPGRSAAECRADRQHSFYQRQGLQLTPEDDIPEKHRKNSDSKISVGVVIIALWVLDATLQAHDRHDDTAGKFLGILVLEITRTTVGSVGVIELNPFREYRYGCSVSEPYC